MASSTVFMIAKNEEMEEKNRLKKNQRNYGELIRAAHFLEHNNKQALFIIVIFGGALRSPYQKKFNNKKSAD